MAKRGKKSEAGVIEIDMRECPSFPEGFGRGIIDPMTIIPGGSFLREEILTCEHCQKDSVKNRNRTRARGHCPACNGYLCDRCDGLKVITGCISITKVVEELREGNARNLNLREI